MTYFKDVVLLRSRNERTPVMKLTYPGTPRSLGPFASPEKMCADMEEDRGFHVNYVGMV